MISNAPVLLQIKKTEQFDLWIVFLHRLSHTELQPFKNSPVFWPTLPFFHRTAILYTNRNTALPSKLSPFNCLSVYKFILLINSQEGDSARNLNDVTKSLIIAYIAQTAFQQNDVAVYSQYTIIADKRTTDTDK